MNRASTQAVPLRSTIPIYEASVIGYLLVLIAGVIFVSVAFLSKQSLRLDEAQSLWQSSHSPLGVINVISHDVHVPLYGLILHFWLTFFGVSVSAARLLSLVFFILAIIAIFAVAAVAFNKRIAFFTTFLVATSPFLNWYGNETRMYSMLTLITILNQYFFVKIFLSGTEALPRKVTAWWWGFAVTALIGVYTHYFFWLLLLSEGVFFLWQQSQFPKHSFRNLAVVAVLLVAAVLPWLWYVFSQNGASQTVPHLLKPSTVDLFNAVSQFLFGFQDDHVNTIILSLWPLAVLFGFLSMKKKNRPPLQAQFFLLCALLPIIVAFVVSVFIKPVFLARYLILAAPSLYLFLAWFFSTYPPKVGLVVRLSLVAIMIFTLIVQTTSANTPVKENYKQASDYISSRASGDDVVALSAPFTLYPFEYYFNGQPAVVTIPDWNPYSPDGIPNFSESDLEAEVGNLRTSHNKIWLLLSYDQGYQKDIYQYFETHYQRLDHQTFSPGMDLYVYQLRY